MKKVFVIGRISSPDHVRFLQNVKRGIDISARLLSEGFNVSCPFLDFQYILSSNHHVPLSHLRQVCYDEIDRCNLVLCTFGWEGSANCCAEREYVLMNQKIFPYMGLRLYYDIDELIKAEK